MTEPENAKDQRNEDAVAVDDRIQARAEQILGEWREGQKYPRRNGLGLDELAEEIGARTPLKGSGQTVGRWIRKGRATKVDGGRITKNGERGGVWIIAVEDAAHIIAVMCEGQFFGSWWAAPSDQPTVAGVLRYSRHGVPSGALDPTPGLDALRSAFVELLLMEVAEVERMALDDIAADVDAASHEDADRRARKT